jgi:hypothetical protein
MKTRVANAEMLATLLLTLGIGHATALLVEMKQSKIFL